MDKDFLTDIERAKVIQFNEDEVMTEAVRKVLLASIYSNGILRKSKKSNPTINAAFGLVSLASSGKGVVSNEDLGQDLRGLWSGIQLLEVGLNQLKTIKAEELEGIVPPNPAI